MKCTHLVTVPLSNRRVCFEHGSVRGEVYEWLMTRSLYVGPDSYLISYGEHLCLASGLNISHPYAKLVFFFFADEEIAVEFQLRFC